MGLHKQRMFSDWHILCSQMLKLHLAFDGDFGIQLFKCFIVISTLSLITFISKLKLKINRYGNTFFFLGNQRLKGGRDRYIITRRWAILVCCTLFVLPAVWDSSTRREFCNRHFRSANWWQNMIKQVGNTFDRHFKEVYSRSLVKVVIFEVTGYRLKYI